MGWCAEKLWHFRVFCRHFCWLYRNTLQLIIILIMHETKSQLCCDVFRKESVFISHLVEVRLIVNGWLVFSSANIFYRHFPQFSRPHRENPQRCWCFTVFLKSRHEINICGFVWEVLPRNVLQICNSSQKDVLNVMHLLHLHVKHLLW